MSAILSDYVEEEAVPAEEGNPDDDDAEFLD